MNPRDRDINLNLLMAQAALVATLAPYLEHIPRLIGYALAFTVVILASLLFVNQPGYLGKVSKISRNSPHFWIFALFLLLSQYINGLFGLIGLWGLMKTIGYVIIGISAYLVFPAVFKGGKSGRLWSFLAKLGALFSLLGIIIVVNGGLEIFGLSWKPSYTMVGLGIHSTKSIFFDSNYFAVVTFVGFITSLYVLKSKSFNRLWAMSFLLLNLLGLLLTYSRAAYVTLFVALVVWFTIDSKLPQKVPIMLIVILIAIGSTIAVQTSPQLQLFSQIKRGGTGRELLWPAALRAIAERPLVGWGVGNVAQVIHNAGLPWASSHNSFLDFFIMTGLLTGLIYIWLIAISITRLYFSRKHSVERRFLLAAVSGMVLLVQFTTHTVGGVSFGSFILTLLLGMANAIPITMNCEILGTQPPSLSSRKGEI